MAQHKVDPNQLDIFETDKQTRLQQENAQYEARKASITREITETEAALRDASWQDQSEYQQDLNQCHRDLEALEKEHTKAVAEIMNSIER